MALAAIGGSGICVPPHMAGFRSDTPTTSGFTAFSAADQGCGMVVIPLESANVRKVRFRTGTVTSGGTSDLNVAIQALGGDGLPSGNWATNTNIAHDLIDTDDNIWITTAALTADAAVVKGTPFAVTIQNPNTGFGNWNLSGQTREAFGLPHPLYHNGTSWAKNTTVGIPQILLEKDDGTFLKVAGIIGGQTSGTTAFNNGSGSPERGNIFQVAAPMRVEGFWAVITNAAAADFRILLYSSDGTTVLARTPTVDGEVGQGGLRYFAFDPTLASTIDLAASTNYRVVVQPQSANSVTLYRYDVTTAAVLDLYPLGQNCHTTAGSSGSWTQTTTSREMLGVIASHFDDGAGSSAVGVPSSSRMGGLLQG